MFYVAWNRQAVFLRLPMYAAIASRALVTGNCTYRAMRGCGFVSGFFGMRCPVGPRPRGERRAGPPISGDGADASAPYAAACGSSSHPGNTKTAGWHVRALAMTFARSTRNSLDHVQYPRSWTSWTAECRSASRAGSDSSAHRPRAVAHRTSEAAVLTLKVERRPCCSMTGC